MTVRHLIGVFGGALVLWAGLAAAPASAQADRSILQLEGLTATFDGPQCGPTVKTIITGPDRSFFTGAAPKVDALTRGARQLISSSCPAMGRLIVRGRVAGASRTIYNAMLERPNNWRPSIVSATSSQAFLSEAAVGGVSSPDRANWRANPGFMTGPAVLQLAGAGYLCADADAAGTCGASTQYRNVAGGSGVQVSRFVADNQGGEATVTNRLSINDGFFCVDASLGEIAVTGGNYTPDGRREMVEQLGERVRDVGTLCTGYVKAGASVTAKTFNADGRAVTADAARVSVSASAPTLSLRR